MALKGVLCVSLLSLWILQTSGQIPTISPLVIEGREGETVMFSCTVGSPSIGSDLSIDVFSEAANDFVGAMVGGRLTRQDDGQSANFNFGPLEASDNNTMYQCATSRDASEIAVVSVIFTPIITRVSPVGDPIRVREGEAITVELNVSANPQPNSYEWTRTRNSMQQIVMNDDRITVSLNSIVFNPTSRNDSGEYRLVANNSAGSSDYSFTLDVQYPPQFPSSIVTPNTFNCSSDGQICASYPGVSTTFFCDATGNPLPTVTRSVSGVSDQSNVDLVTGRDIMFNSVIPGNTGTYTCMAASQVLSETLTITRTIRLYVGGVAQPLSRVVLTINEDDVTVVATWLHDNSRAVNPVPAQYFIATVSQDGMQIGELFIINVNTTSLTIPGSLFESGSTYTVSVVVRNLQGDSEAISASVTIPEGFNNNALATSVSYMLGFFTLIVTALLF